MLQADSRAALPDALQALQLQAATMAVPTASVQRKAERLNTLKDEIDALTEQIERLAEDLAQVSISHNDPSSWSPTSIHSV